MTVWMDMRDAPHDAAYRLSLEDLELSVRAYNALRWDFKTVADVARASASRLMRQPNFGLVSLADVRQALHKHGLSLSGE